MRASKILLIVMFLSPAAGEAQIRVRPGQYEYTIDMNLGVPGGQEAMDAVLGAAGAGSGKQKRLQCIAADDVKDMQDADSIIKVFAREMQDDGCKISNAKTTGNKLTYTATCDEGMTITTEMTFTGDSLSGISKGSYEGRPFSSKISAKRIGECPK
jgi:hypothetical protein